MESNHEPLSDEALGRLAELERAASEVPWTEADATPGSLPKKENGWVSWERPCQMQEVDYNLILAARNALPSLLAEVRASREAFTGLESLKAMLLSLQGEWQATSGGVCDVAVVVIAKLLEERDALNAEVAALKEECQERAEAWSNLFKGKLALESERDALKARHAKVAKAMVDLLDCIAAWTLPYPHMRGLLNDAANIAALARGEEGAS